MVFTNKFIEHLKPKPTPYRVWEGGSDPGFGVQVTPKGVKTFFLFYRFNGRRCFYKLGRYPNNTSIAEARQKARGALKLLSQGIDPRAHETHAKAAEAAAQREAALRGSVAQLFEAYAAHLDAKGSHGTAKTVRNIFKHDIAPVIGETTKAQAVAPQHVKAVLHRIINRGAMIQANRVRAYMSAAYVFGIEHDNDPRNFHAEVLFGLERNPVRDVPKPTKFEKPGERDLSISEIYALWHGLEQTSLYKPVQLAVKLCLATGGQRIGEVLGATWVEFDVDRMIWELPSWRTKNGKPHIVPLTPVAVELLDDLRAYSSDGHYLFPKLRNASEPMELGMISKAIDKFCQTIDANGQRIDPGTSAKPFRKFIPRDLRRTCKSRMGEIGISKLICDRLHNHALQDVSSKHYDRYDYLPEKRQAMQTWGGYLQAVIAGSKVVPIQGAKTA
jgi:integrase